MVNILIFDDHELLSIFDFLSPMVYIQFPPGFDAQNVKQMNSVACSQLANFAK